MSDHVTVTVTRDRLFQFLADFGMEGVKPLRFDEPPPLGDGAGPSASRVLAAAVGACLSASALYCLEKAHVPVEGVRATVDGALVRNDRGRLRIPRLAAKLELEIQAEDRDRITRCFSLFEDFCVVTESVRAGIEVDVTVEAVAPEAVA